MIIQKIYILEYLIILIFRVSTTPFFWFNIILKWHQLLTYPSSSGGWKKLTQEQNK